MDDNSQILGKLQRNIEKTKILLNSVEIELNEKENKLTNVRETLQEK